MGKISEMLYRKWKCIWIEIENWKMYVKQSRWYVLQIPSIPKKLENVSFKAVTCIFFWYSRICFDLFLIIDTVWICILSVSNVLHTSSTWILWLQECVYVWCMCMCVCIYVYIYMHTHTYRNLVLCLYSMIYDSVFPAQSILSLTILAGGV